jgi:hypothetical protein
MQCIGTDGRNEKLYRAVLYRDGFIEGNRFFKYMLDTQQLQDFARWERNQQATQLASYRGKGKLKRTLKKVSGFFLHLVIGRVLITLDLLR